MKELDLVQGSKEWLQARKQYRTASEAPIMMGVSPYAERSELIAITATRYEKEVSEELQKIFDWGHEVEAKARPLAEDLIGEKLLPLTGTDDDDYLLASFDGLTMLEDTVWECKQWNQSKADHIQRHGTVPECDYWQCVQQLAVSGAERLLYTVTDGTKDKFVYCWMSPSESDKKRLIAGWKQFDKDVAEYSPTEAKVEPEGVAPETLPALHIQVKGEVVDSNLAQFTEHAMMIINAINTDLKTDEDFANAEKTIKYCKESEDRLEAAVDHMLSQASSIYDAKATMDDLLGLLKAKRNELDRLVKAKKKTIREGLLLDAANAVKAYSADVHTKNNFNHFGVSIPIIATDFGSVIKGKKLFSSMQSALDDAVAAAKIEVDQLADQINKNLEFFQENASEFKTLFHDLNNLVAKSRDDFKACVQVRINEHKEAEAKRKEKEAQKKAEAEVKAKEDSIPAEKPEVIHHRTSEQPSTTRRRPTDDQIIGVLCEAFQVNEFKVIDWLSTIDLERAEKRLAS